MRVALWPVGPSPGILTEYVIADRRTIGMTIGGLLIRHWFGFRYSACTRRPRRVLCRSRAFAVRCCSCLRSPMGARAHKRALPPPPHAPMFPMHLTVFIIRAHSQPHAICAWRRARRMQHSADGGTSSPAVSAEWIDCVQGPLSAHHHGAHHALTRPGHDGRRHGRARQGRRAAGSVAALNMACWRAEG